MDDADSTSASAVINAEPAVVWDVVQSPESACSLGAWPAIHSGYVPSTPRDEPGEMQYFIRLRSDGQLTAEVIVVSELSERHSAVTHFLRGAPQLEQSYLLVPESEAGPTRLDLTCRWPASKLGDNREAVRGRMAEAMRELATGYKSLIENAGDEA